MGLVGGKYIQADALSNIKPDDELERTNSTKKDLTTVKEWIMCTDDLGRINKANFENRAKNILNNRKNCASVTK